MEDLYLDELRTPPIPLAALVGLPELHSIISSYLHTETSPINTLALPDFSKVGILAGKERRLADTKLPSPAGILKIDWLRKHRTRVPAVLVVLLGRDEVYGDPVQWLQVCTNLDNIKNVIRGRNTKLVIVIGQPTAASGEVVEERLMTLRKRAEVDAKFFQTFISQESPEQKRSLARLGNMLSELVTLFYKEEGRQVKLRLEKKAFSSVELSVRYSFKVAVYAEFRRDWVEALKYYESAYSYLQEVVTAPIESQPVQRLVELKTVAEQLHFKVSTLLLHGGKETEAVKWFRQHMGFYKPLVGPSEGTFLHWGWVSKQYLIFALLLQSSLTPVTPTKLLSASALLEAPVTERELQPAYYYQLAAHHVIERRRSFESSSGACATDKREQTVDVLGGSSEEVGPPLYVGQAPILLTRGTTIDTQCPTDEEYMFHAVMQEKVFPHSATAINLLKRAYDEYTRIQASRMAYYVACEMGAEYFTSRDYPTARKLFDSVAGMYRKEAWVSLLWSTLGFLRECARQLGLLQEYIEYSLEMAALPSAPSSSVNEVGGVSRQVGPAGSLSRLQREQVCTEVFKVLHGEESLLPSGVGETGLVVYDPVVLNIDVASPLRAVLVACAAFHGSTVKPGTVCSLTLSLLTHLPHPLELDELEVHFNQPSCNLVLVKDTQVLDSVAHEDLEVKGGFDLHLEPSKWRRLSIDMIPGHSGKLECLTVTARLGKSASIVCQVESPASRDDVLYWKLESQIEMFPFKDSALALFGQKTIQVEEQDHRVELLLVGPADGPPALVGELYPVDVSICSREHSIHTCELKLSLAESFPGSTSPQTPSSTFVDMLLVEIFTFAPSQEGVEPELQKFAGRLEIPAIAHESTFTTRFYLKWKEARPISVFAMFSYQMEVLAGADTASHPLRFFVHKGVQLQCEEPWTVTHKYMPRFRQDALMLGSFEKPTSRDSHTVCVPVNDITTLVVTVKNSSSSNLELLSLTIDEENGSTCSVTAAGPACRETADFSSARSCVPRDDRLFLCMALGAERRQTFPLHGPACRETTDFSSARPLARQQVQVVGSFEQSRLVSLIMPEESFASLYHVRPIEANSMLAIGMVRIEWKRATVDDESLPSPSVSKVIPLPPLQVENPAIMATFHCPPHAILAVPFDVSLGLQNFTALIQEVDFMVVDSPGFILSGAHSDTVHILPYSENVISCRLVPIGSGMQQLPQFNLKAKRFNAGLQQSPSTIQIFVYPSTRPKHQMLHAS